jgi:hypothetical protein
MMSDLPTISAEKQEVPNRNEVLQFIFWQKDRGLFNAHLSESGSGWTVLHGIYITLIEEYRLEKFKNMVYETW